MVKLVFDASTTAIPSFADRQIQLTFGRSKTETRWTDKRTMSFAELSVLLSKAEIGPKDGLCYTPAVFSGVRRNKMDATNIDIIVLDSDCGQTEEEIRQAIEKHGWIAIYHSTSSHLTDTTMISAEAADKWLAENLTLSLPDYMEKKGYLKRVVESATIEDEITLSDGKRNYVVRHNPCPKFRLLLLILTGWNIANFESQNIANAVWRERIGATSAQLNLYHDQACVDSSRLFYTPRIKQGQTFVHGFIPGKPIDLWSLPDASHVASTHTAVGGLFDVTLDQQPQLAKKPTLVRSDHRTFKAKDNKWIDLTSWAAKYAERFEVATALRARASHLLGSRVSGVKQHLLCPNSKKHMTSETDRTGTFVVNSSDLDRAELPSITSGFVIHCSHAGCADLDRLDHLHALLCDGALSIPDLTSEDFLTPDLEQVDTSAILLGKSDVPPPSAKESNIPISLITGLPGVMGEIIGYILNGSIKPQPTLALGATLAFMGAAIGRRVKLQHFETRPNIYALGIAVSGAGKDRALSCLQSLASAAGLYEKLIGAEEIASDAGLISSAVQQPNQIMLIDEINFLFNAANNARAGVHIVNVVSTLLKLYSSSHKIFKGKSYADEKKLILVDQPCVCLYGCSTPKGLFKSLTSSDINNGLLSRMVLFDAGEHDPRGATPVVTQPPQTVVDWLLAWDSIDPIPNPLRREGGKTVLDPLTVVMTSDAMELCEKFEDEMHAAKTAARERGLDSLYVRARENALKFALVRACSPHAVSAEHGSKIDASNLHVDAECMAWAIELSKATIAGMEAGARDEISDTMFETKGKNLRDIIKKAGRHGLTTREVAKHSAGKLPQKERDDLLRMLLDAGDAVYIDVTKEGKPGPRRLAYVHKAFVKKVEPDDNA